MTVARRRKRIIAMTADKEEKERFDGGKDSLLAIQGAFEE